jgi:hypothetical protein
VSKPRFQIGQSVFLTSGPQRVNGARGVFKIVKLLPTEDDDQLYRIKSANEPHERVAKESQLEHAA